MTSGAFEDMLGLLRADGIGPSDFGPAAPGIARLLRTLSSGPATGELAGEQAALAMFRSQAGALAKAPDHEQTARHRPERIRHLGLLRPVRVAAATTAVLLGGFAAAAYAAVLPAPVQHIAHQAFHYIGVPDSGNRLHSGKPGTRSGSTSRGSRPAPGPSRVTSHPGPSASPRPSSPGPPSPARSGHVSPTASPHASASASPSATAPVALTAQAAASRIPAGSAVTVDGVLTAGGQPVVGMTVSLLEHVAGQPGWIVAGTGSTTSQGSVAITEPALGTTARFRLKASDGATSPAVRVVAIPSVTLSIRLGSLGVKDYLKANTAYAQPGDAAVLQVQRSGVWITRQARTLNSAGAVTFVLNAQRMQGKIVRVVLLATTRHGRAASAPLHVPPPA